MHDCSYLNVYQRPAANCIPVNDGGNKVNCIRLGVVFVGGWPTEVYAKAAPHARGQVFGQVRTNMSNGATLKLTTQLCLQIMSIPVLCLIQTLSSGLALRWRTNVTISVASWSL